ncbi:glycosyltransferase [Chryseobacterium sp. NEB161]|nr:glycosyltransferase [Chryseobacterium sp. NEB161]
MVNKVIFFTYGDSSDASTWSNVPYLFTKTLRDKGITVYDVNLAGNKWLRRFFDRIIVPVFSIFFPDHQYSFSRSRILRLINNYKIKNSVKKHSNADLCIFTNFDYYNKFTDIPTLLFCDWTYDVLINDRLKRKTYFFENWFLSQQKDAIVNAKYVISLFPECAASIKNTYPTANVQYLGSNVINSMFTGILNQDIIEVKKKSKEILFIGGEKYKDGAQKLVNAFTIFSKKNPNYKLNLIGIKSEWIKSTSTDVLYHGYLRKDVEEENKRYYNLMLKANFVINPTPLWAGYSSMIEAMYFYTPVITTPYKDFVTEFGNNIKFGLYVENDHIDNILDCMEKMIQTKNYEEMCLNAHQSVEKYSWENYTNKLLNLVNS